MSIIFDLFISQKKAVDMKMRVAHASFAERQSASWNSDLDSDMESGFVKLKLYVFFQLFFHRASTPRSLERQIDLVVPRDEPFLSRVAQKMFPRKLSPREMGLG
jgi:hypothetical protein